jgi:hypothetical protein
MIMINMLFDFLIGLLAGRAAANTARTARNTAALVELAAMTEAQKVAFQKRQAFLAGQRRFVFHRLRRDRRGGVDRERADRRQLSRNRDFPASSSPPSPSRPTV